MATYPIKMLNDENNNAFIPITSSAAVMDENGLSIDHLMNEGKYKIQNNLTTEEAGIGVLDASQGKILKDYVDNNRYTLSVASSEALGGIKVGENLEITEDGTLNSIGGGYTPPVNAIYYMEDFPPESYGDSMSFLSMSSRNIVSGNKNALAQAIDDANSKWGRAWTFIFTTRTNITKRIITKGSDTSGGYVTNFDKNTLVIVSRKGESDYYQYVALAGESSSGLNPRGTISKASCYNSDVTAPATITTVNEDTNTINILSPVGLREIARKSDITSQINTSVKVTDVKVNGSSVVDSNKIANIPVKTYYAGNNITIDSNNVISSNVDLSNYYTKEEVDAMITNVLNQLTYKPVEEEKTNISNILGENTDTIEYDMTNTEVSNALDEVIGGNE